MSDSSNEVDEEFEQLRVAIFIFLATRLFVYTVPQDSLRCSSLVRCESLQNLQLLVIDCLLQNAFIEELVMDIIDDVTCGLCFEIHRACKLGILFLDETDPEYVTTTSSADSLLSSLLTS